jgi:hypothetical protein
VANRRSHPIAADHKSEWQVFLENRDAVIEALKRGECDGILPAARGFLDGFAGFLLDAGILAVLEQFADSRQRRSIPIFFFCHTLIYRPLFRLARLAAIEQTLFRSPYILRQLGFNARQIEHGFYHTPDSQRPFTVEAIPECFAGSQASDFLVHQQQVLRKLVDYCPGELRSQLWVMDSVYISVPAGAHTPGLHFKVCVLGIWQDQVVWPLLWAFVPAEQHDLPAAKRLVEAAEAVLGQGFMRHLLLDRGFLDGAWLSDLYDHGTRVTIGVKEDMRVMEELHNLSRLPDTIWTEVAPPKLHGQPPPQRLVTGFADLQNEWPGCRAPLAGCLIQDRYPERIQYQGLVTTATAAQATEIHSNNRQRWTLEEVFMTLTRYWRFDDLPPCREGVAYAWVHFALVAFTLLGFYLQETDTAQSLKSLLTAPPPFPVPERELAVYAGPYFALLRPSQLLEIILSHVDAWQANRSQLLMALRLCEGNT